MAMESVPGRRQPGVPFSSLRAKLFVAVGGIVVLFVLAMVASERGTSALERSLDSFSDRVLPRAAALQELSVEVASLDRLVANVSLARTELELESIERGFDRALGRCVELLEDVGEDGAQLDLGVDALASSTRHLFEARREQLGLEREVRVRVDQLEEESSELMIRLEESLLMEVESEADALVNRELRLGLLHMSSVSSALPDARDIERIQALEDELRIEGRRVVRLLTSLPASIQEEISDMSAGLLEGATGLDGVLRKSRRVAALDDRIRSVDADAGAARLSVRHEAQRIAVRRSTEVASAQAAAHESASRARLLVRLSFLAALLLSVVLLVVYVQGSLVGRLRQLADDMTRLSRGELDVEVREGGDVEFARLASAAEVFRRNALELERALGTLAQRNASLGEFAHVASHDLKSPMRAISNLSQWVLEDCTELLPDASVEHLNLLRGRAERMENLLEDLLRYARLGNDASIVESVRFGDVMEDVLAVLSLPASVQVDVRGEDTEIRTVKAPLELVLRNLIQNAVRHHDGDAPHIVVSAEPLPDPLKPAVRLTVQDDGPGIPDDRREEAFRVFRRLEATTDGPGTGMGLALVKRAVELIGGELELEWSFPDREPPRGCRFVFRWPFGIASSDEPLPVQSRGSATMSQ